MSANAGFVTAVIILTFVMRFWLAAKNKKMLREDPETRLLYAY
jgi:hypothetical protein